MLFLQNVVFMTKVLNFDQNRKMRNMDPKDKENRYVYKGWRHGGENVIFAPKVRNFDDFAIWEPKWNSVHFLESNPENHIFHVLLTTKRARIVL